MLTFTITGQTLKVSTPTIAADTMNYLTARFTFTRDWDGLIKIARFSNDENSAEVQLTNDCIREEDGLNLTEGRWYVSVIGELNDGGQPVQRITTTRAFFTVLPSGVEDGEPLPSLPSYGEQILAEVEDINEKLGSFTAEAETLPAGSAASASYDPQEAVFSFGIPRGDKGDPGDDGFSPTATVTKTGKTATITITDKDGTTTASVTDGEDGTDGISPVATVEKTGKTAMITITDANGTTTATVSDGEDGDPGQDGVTPSFSIGTVTTGAAGSDASATITGTDAEPVLNLTIPRGDPGEVTEADLAEALLDKANVITDSASGAVASFPDGAAAPVVGLSVGIEPVQDLHGYDNPWPAGGGKQLFNMVPENINDSQNYSMTGTEGDYTLTSTGSYGRVSFLVPGLTIGEKYTFNVYLKKPTTDGTNTSIYFNDSNSWAYSNGALSLGTGVVSTETRKYITFTATSETLFIGFYISEGNTSGNVINVRGAMLSKGETQETFAPYANVCPITGFTAARVTRCGKNLIDVSDITDYTKWSATVAPGGDMGSTTVNRIYSLPKIKGGVQYTISFGVTSSSFPSYLYFGYYKDGITTRIAYVTTEWVAHPVITFTAIEGVTYCLRMGSTLKESDFEGRIAKLAYIQLELGSTATSYEPYAGQVYDISWQTEAGTVYGGSLDAVSGVLTVTHGVVDMGTLSFTVITSGNNVYYAPITGAKSDTGTGNTPDMNCSVYKITSAKSATAWGLTNEDGVISLGYDSARIYLRDTTITDATQIPTLRNGQTVVYPLATPLTYQLTPTEVETLLGTNNVWADTGDTAVTYRADTKKYIDKKLAELVAQIVNS